MPRNIDKIWIDKIGRPALWQQAHLSLVDFEGIPGQINYLEQDSYDRGYVYGDAEDIVALFTSDDRKEDFTQVGAWEKGSCLMTFHADLEIGEQDRIIWETLQVRRRKRITLDGNTTQSLGKWFADELIQVATKNIIYKGTIDANISSDPCTGETSLTWIATPPESGTLVDIMFKGKAVWIVEHPPMKRAWGPKPKDHLLTRARLMRDDTLTRGC